MIRPLFPSFLLVVSACVIAVQAGPEMYQIHVDAGNPVALGMGDEGAAITATLGSKYACHSLQGPKCGVTNGQEDLLASAQLAELLKQVLAQTVKATAKDAKTASGTGNTDATATTEAQTTSQPAQQSQQQSQAEQAKSAQQKQPVLTASTTSLDAHMEELLEEVESVFGGVGGDMQAFDLHDAEAAANNGEVMAAFLIDETGQKKRVSAEELKQYLAQMKQAGFDPHSGDAIQVQYMDEEEEEH